MERYYKKHVQDVNNNEREQWSVICQETFCLKPQINCFLLYERHPLLFVTKQISPVTPGCGEEMQHTSQELFIE